MQINSGYIYMLYLSYSTRKSTHIFFVQTDLGSRHVNNLNAVMQVLT